VSRSFDVQALAVEQGLRRSRGYVLLLRGREQIVVFVAPGLVVVLDARQLRIREDGCELLQLAAGLELEPAVPAQRPAALPLLLILVTARVALAGTGLDIVEPHVFGALAVRPRLLARDRTRVAADALVEVHHHRHLRHDSHQRASCSRGSLRSCSCVWAMASV